MIAAAAALKASPSIGGGRLRHMLQALPRSDRLMLAAAAAASLSLLLFAAAAVLFE